MNDLIDINFKSYKWILVHESQNATWQYSIIILKAYFYMIHSVIPFNQKNDAQYFLPEAIHSANINCDLQKKYKKT